MTITYPTGVLFVTQMGGDFLSHEPKVCTCCQRMAHWFRNENGVTTCISCADETK
jgi:hypothetical protein